MTLHQGEAFALVGLMLVLFISDRFRYDLVAALILSAAALLGVVSPDQAFSGFANPVIIIIAAVLVLGRAVAISGVVESALRPILARLASTSLQVGALTACVTLLSALMKNVGALGIFMPIAIATAQRQQRSPSLYLMPLAFGSLIGGTITQIGTSPNLLISAVAREVHARRFTLFDFTPVGLPLSILAVLFLSVGWRLIPRGRRGQASPEARFKIEEYTSEARLAADSPFVDKTVRELESLADGKVLVSAIERGHNRRYIPAHDWTLDAGDTLVLQGDPVALQPVLEGAKLELLAAEDLPGQGERDSELEAEEAVVTEGSPMVGHTLEDLAIRSRYGVNILAIARRGQPVRTPLQRTRLRIGDTVLVQGRHNALPESVAQLGLLPLAQRNLSLGDRRQRTLPLLILALSLAAIAFHLVSAQLGFFLAAILVVLFGTISPRQAYDAIDWPIIVMLGSLIPVGEALRETGAAGLVANLLTAASGHLPGQLAVGFMLLIAMAVTPFMHHAAAVLVMGPVAAAVAHNLHFAPEPFLMAVALGASCDFLTPIGHQNNLIIMGPGGYRFSDYWRLGLPLTLMVLVCGTLLITWWWPLC